jgi:hypothetical protein
VTIIDYVLSKVLVRTGYFEKQRLFVSQNDRTLPLPESVRVCSKRRRGDEDPSSSGTILLHLGGQPDHLL